MTDERWSEWKEILGLTPDGKVNVDQLKLELTDFDNMIHKMESITHLISGGKLSYATYPLNTLKSIYYEELEEQIESRINDMIEDGELTKL